MIEAICFDLDGTLIHYAQDYSALVRQMPGRLGVSDLEPFLKQYALELRTPGAQNFGDVVERTLLQFGRTPPPDFADFCQESIAAYTQGIELLPGALQTLHYFSHLPLGLITNGPSDMQRAALAKAGIGPYFKAVVVSGDVDVAVRKPDPRIFQIACERLGVAPEKVLMIGDNLEADIQGAQAFGMQALLKQ